MTADEIAAQLRHAPARQPRRARRRLILMMKSRFNQNTRKETHL